MAADLTLPTSAAEAEQVALAHVTATTGSALDPTIERLVVLSQWTATLAHGWVVTVSIHNDSPDPCKHRTGSPDVLYVEAATGRLIAFDPYTSSRLQERVYRIVQGHEPDLTWPQITGVRCADGDHLVVDLLPHHTTCGRPLTGQEPACTYDDAVLECLACFVATAGITARCLHCGKSLPQTTPPWYCATCPQPAPASD